MSKSYFSRLSAYQNLQQSFVNIQVLGHHSLSAKSVLSQRRVCVFGAEAPQMILMWEQLSNCKRIGQCRIELQLPGHKTCVKCVLGKDISPFRNLNQTLRERIHSKWI